jgi:hypothetical protein
MPHSHPKQSSSKFLVPTFILLMTPLTLSTQALGHQLHGKKLPVNILRNGFILNADLVSYVSDADQILLPRSSSQVSVRCTRSSTTNSLKWIPKSYKVSSVCNHALKPKFSPVVSPVESARPGTFEGQRSGSLGSPLYGDSASLPLKWHPPMVALSPDSQIMANITILSPRNTSTTESKPILRWISTGDVNCCKITIMGPGITWTKQVEMTPDMLENPKIAYDGPILKAGSQYELQIKTESGNKLGFTTFDILNDATTKQLSKEIVAIQQKKNLSEEAKVLEISNLEQNNNLYASAIERMERFISKGSTSSSSYKLLGDLYLQIDLPDRAKEKYRIALDLMKKNSSLKAEGEISINLGIIEEELGNIPQAIVWMDRAQQSFSKLNDREKVQSLRDRISELKSRK